MVKRNQPAPGIKLIVLVGHCPADVYSLKLAIQRAGISLPVDSAGGLKALDKLDLANCLLLINRRLPSSYPVATGVELIKLLKARSGPPETAGATGKAAPPTAGVPSAAPVMMLISDYPDAQQQAEQAGALPGFGKSELMTDQTAQRLRAAVGGIGNR